MFYARSSVVVLSVWQPMKALEDRKGLSPKWERWQKAESTQYAHSEPCWHSSLTYKHDEHAW